MRFAAMTGVFGLCVFVACLATLNAQMQCSDANTGWATNELETVSVTTTNDVDSVTCTCIRAPRGAQIEMFFLRVNINSSRDDSTGYMATGMCHAYGDRLLVIDRPDHSSKERTVLLELCEKGRRPQRVVSSGNAVNVCFHKKTEKGSSILFEYRLLQGDCDGTAKVIFNEFSPSWFHSPYYFTSDMDFQNGGYPSNLKFQHWLLTTEGKGINYTFSKFALSGGECRADVLSISSSMFTDRGMVATKADYCGPATPFIQHCTYGNAVLYEFNTDGDRSDDGYVGDWQSCAPTCYGKPCLALGGTSLG